MTDLTAKVGIYGVGGINSVGFGLGKLLYTECASCGLPTDLLLFNRSFSKNHSFLKKMQKDLSHGNLKIFGASKQNRILEYMDESMELRYEHGKQKINARACPTLNDFLEQTDSANSVVVVSYDAAKGWWKWMQQASPEEKMNVRDYLYYHNLQGAIEFGNALKNYADKQGHVHQALRIIVTNPPCRINDTIRRIAGDAAGLAAKSTVYAAIDEERIIDEMKMLIRQRFPAKELEKEFGGKLYNEIKNIFQAGRHAGNIPSPDGNKILNSVILWSAMRLGGNPFYDVFGHYSHLKQLKEDIERGAHSAFLKELEEYDGRTTSMIVPSLGEVVLDILANKDFSEKKAYTTGIVFKIPGTDTEFTFVWPVVYKDWCAWPFARFADSHDISRNIDYKQGETPEVRDFGFIRDILKEDEIADCNFVCQSIEEKFNETDELIENPKKIEELVEKHSFEVKKPSLIIKRVSLENLLKIPDVFLRKNVFNYSEAYEKAMDSVNRNGYNPEDIVLLAENLHGFEEHERFYMLGCLISAMINSSFRPGLKLELNFPYSKRLDAVGIYNEADLTLKGALGHAVGMYMLRGRIEGDNALDYVCQYQSGGRAMFKKIDSSGGKEKRGGILEIGQAQNRLGEKMKSGIIILNGNCRDRLAYAMKGGKIIVNGDARHDTCDQIEGGTVILNGKCRSFGKIFGGEVIWQGKLVE